MAPSHRQKAEAAGPAPGSENQAQEISAQGKSGEKKPKAGGGRYIPWHELLRRTFGDEVVCPHCGGALRLLGLIKTERTIRTLLGAMHMPAGPPKVFAPGPEPTDEESLEWRGDEGATPDWPD